MQKEGTGMIRGAYVDDITCIVAFFSSEEEPNQDRQNSDFHVLDL